MYRINLFYNKTFATATVCDSLSKTINTKIRNKIIKYEQELLKSAFDFESNNKVLELLGIELRSAKKGLRPWFPK